MTAFYGLQNTKFSPPFVVWWETHQSRHPATFKHLSVWQERFCRTHGVISSKKCSKCSARAATEGGYQYMQSISEMLHRLLLWGLKEPRRYERRDPPKSGWDPCSWQKKILSSFPFLNSCCAGHDIWPKAAASRKQIDTSKAWKDWHVCKTWQTHGKEENRKSWITPERCRGCQSPSQWDAASTDMTGRTPFPGDSKTHTEEHVQIGYLFLQKRSPCYKKILLLFKTHDVICRGACSLHLGLDQLPRNQQHSSGPLRARHKLITSTALHEL